MSHARSSMWWRKPLPMWTPAEEEAWRARMASERLRDWLDELAERANEWRRFEPGYEGYPSPNQEQR